MPAGWDVAMGVYRRPLDLSEPWKLQGTISGLSEAEQVLDLAELFRDAEPGLWRLTLQSGPGQPQGGRLTADVSGWASGPSPASDWQRAAGGAARGEKAAHAGRCQC